MASATEGELRRRRNADEKIDETLLVDEESTKSEEIVWGKTPSGEVFKVPTTHDVLTLFHPAYPKSHIDILNLALLGLQIALFYVLPNAVAKPFFLLYFAFWRLSYDAGLGWILTKQSKKKWIVREVQRLGWLDETRRPNVKNWIRKQLAGKMGKDYSFDELPLEYNTWLLFRQLVDIILLNDFLSYCMFALSCFRIPDGLSIPVHISRWIGGITLIAFNLWVKTEAHHVVKDYGWYWGDVFFQRGALIFDGVFELAPHPMYSVGYAGYYGLSLIVGSYPVLFVSLAAHAAQFAFLVFFENPHIERMYGQRKLLAQRIPLSVTNECLKRNDEEESKRRSKSIDSTSSIFSTPAATEGDTATDTELEPETEVEHDTEYESNTTILDTPKASSRSQDSSLTPSNRKPLRALSQHDLLNQFFRKDLLIFHNFDPLRASDFMLALLVFYSVMFACLPNLSYKGTLALHFIHALLWRFYHTFVLGLILQAQSQSKFLVRHFLKHYFYPDNDGGKGAIEEAFTNWKSIYNLSLCMTYTSFIGLALKTYSFPQEWIAGNQLLRHTLGVIFVGLHIWAAKESYEVLGVFGWFFGDFFIEDFPATLEYSGIFRYLNNPEILSGATFIGLSLITGSKLVLVLAIISNLAYWWFLRNVENPHMRKRYGDHIRKDAGMTKIIKKVAARNAQLLESRAGKAAPEIRRVVMEVKGSFDKVYEETAEVVEDFLNKSKPKLSEVMQDTKFLLQQSREKLVITRIASDLSSFDTTKYQISIAASKTGGKYRFHLGEPIIVNWKSPASHSRKDWVGLYRIGANKSSLITNSSSLGMWVPVHDDEWDGDVPIGFGSGPCCGSGFFDRKGDGVYKNQENENGVVVFKGDRLPWHVGTYEIRYHHDGKYNVMSLDGPIEVYVDPPTTLDFSSIRWYLIRIIVLCLDSDPKLVPLSSKPPGTVTETRLPTGLTDASLTRDADDFNFWTSKQAKRIASCIKEAFQVEYDSEVILADANVSALANRILVSKQLLEG